MQVYQRHRTAPLLALLATLGVAAGCGLNVSLDAQAENRWDRTYTLTSGGTLEIRNTSGRIEVEATDGDEVTVAALRRVEAATDQMARDALSAIEIRETVADDHIAIDSTSTDLGMTVNLRRKVDYTIRLPNTANLTIRMTNGDVEVTNVGGRFDVHSTNGRIVARGLGSDASVETTNGAVTLEMARLGTGGVTCETTNGAIQVHLPADANADLSARVTNGTIRHDGVSMTVIEESRRRLDARIGAGGPPVRLQTTNGLIRIAGR